MTAVYSWESNEKCCRFSLNLLVVYKTSNDFIWRSCELNPRCSYSGNLPAMFIAVSWAKLYCGALGFFYNSKNLNCNGALSFFKDLFTHFHFWSQIVVVILVTPKQEVEQKSEWFCGVKFFSSNFKVEWEYGVWTKIRFLGSGFFVHIRQFHFDFLRFFLFIRSDFFLNGFPNPFIVHSRPSFC